MKSRSYDELKAEISDMTTEAQKEFLKGKYWFTLEENEDRKEVFVITDGEEEMVARAVLICREEGKILTKKVKTGMNGKSKGTTTTKGAYSVIELPVLESEIPDVIQLMIEDGNLFIEDGDGKEDAGNLRYWRDFIDGKVHIKMGYDKTIDRFVVEASNLKE